MDFALSREQAMAQAMFREFAQNEVKPLAAEVDEEERFPKETVEKMGKLGMMGIYFPKKYGGAGGDTLTYAMAVEELSKVCGTTGVVALKLKRRYIGIDNHKEYLEISKKRILKQGGIQIDN